MEQICCPYISWRRNKMQKWMRECLEKNIPSIHDIDGIFMNSQQLCISVPALSKPGSVNTSSWPQERYMRLDSSLRDYWQLTEYWQSLCNCIELSKHFLKNWKEKVNVDVLSMLLMTVVFSVVRWLLRFYPHW